MTLNKETFGHDLKSIAQLKVCIQELDDKEEAEVGKIMACEKNLKGIRLKKQYYQHKLICSCDELFTNIHNQLPD